MSNTTENHTKLGHRSIGSIAAVATNAPHNIIVKTNSRRQHTKMIDTSKAFADTGATAIFVMEDVPVNNKRRAIKPLTINLPDGT
jgi:CO/xanthine dehydrogenase Mo-binding subunit